MRLFMKENRPPKEVIEQIANVDLGGKKAGAIMGFQAAFCFYLPDLYVSDGVEQLLDQNPEAEGILHDLLARFKKDDYGDITFLEEEDNGEQRHCWGYYQGLISQYATKLGVIRLDMFYGAGLYYLIHEDITRVICKKPFVWPSK